MDRQKYIQLECLATMKALHKARKFNHICNGISREFLKPEIADDNPEFTVRLGKSQVVFYHFGKTEDELDHVIMFPFVYTMLENDEELRINAKLTLAKFNQQNQEFADLVKPEYLG